MELLLLMNCSTTKEFIQVVASNLVHTIILKFTNIMAIEYTMVFIAKLPAILLLIINCTQLELVVTRSQSMVVINIIIIVIVTIVIIIIEVVIDMQLF